MKLLPRWCLTNTKPTIYDAESGSVIEQTAKVYGAMNELIEEYNKFVDSVNTQITEFSSSEKTDNETFRVGLRQEFQDFIDIVELKIGNFDSYTKEKIRTLFNEVLNELIKNGEFLNIISDVLSSYKTEIMNDVTKALDDKADTDHNHDGRYYTKERTSQLVAEKVQGSVDFTLGVAKDIYSTLNGKSDADHNHNSTYYSKEDIDNMLEGTSASGHNHDSRYYTEDEIDTMLAGMNVEGHTHDDRYYTENEVDIKLAYKVDKSVYDTTTQLLQSALNSKAPENHDHDGRYYTVDEIDTKLAGKSDTGHTHDDRYYTETEVDTKLAGKSDTGHDHDGRYYTEDEIDQKFATFTPSESVKHTARIPAFEDIDNSAFAGKLANCSASWVSACASGDVLYGSLSVDGTDFMSERLNPMLYATRNNGEFTSTYRDILKEIGSGNTDSDGKLKTVNCITLCNMLVMGVPYEGSRLNCHENNIGMSGYSFDICKLLGNDISSNREISYDDNKKLDKTTFQDILTQESFFNTYDKYGLVKTLKSSKNAGEGEMWYDSIRPGDVLWTGSHSMFCLSSRVDDNNVVTINGVHACSSGNITNYNFTVTEYGDIEGIDYNKFLKVARPYLTYNVPESSEGGSEYCKLLKGPFIGIGAETDLNGIRTVGEYRCVKESNVVSLINKPTDLTSTFRLTVENLTKDEATLSKTNDFLQTIVSAKGEVYTRIITTYNHSVQSPYIYPWRKHSMENHTVTDITKPSLDFNSFTKTGIYLQKDWRYARTMLNRPSELEHAFRLTVDNTMDVTFTVQEGTNFTQRIREVNGREFWRRVYWDSEAEAIAFGAWNKVLTETVSTTSEFTEY